MYQNAKTKKAMNQKPHQSLCPQSSTEEIMDFIKRKIYTTEYSAIQPRTTPKAM